jgi:hypothetical protein
VLGWELEPGFVTGGQLLFVCDNLKRVRNHQLGFMFAVESNRRVSLEKGQWVQV